MRILLISILLSGFLFSQDDRLDDLPFDDEPLKDENRSYFAIAGGYTFNVGLLKVDEINNFFNNFPINPDGSEINFEEFSSPLFLHGGGGFTGIPFWRNIRIGFEAWAGSSETNEITQMIGEDNYKMKGEINFAMTAMHADYGYVITDGLALLAGLKLGWSGMNVIYSESKNSYDWETFQDGSNLNMVEMDKSWLFVAPQVSLDWAATEFLMFSISAFYQVNFDNPFVEEIDKNWKVNRTASLDNVPSNLSLDHLNFRLGIYFGLFNY